MDLEMGLAPKSLGFEDRDKKLLVRFIHKQCLKIQSQYRVYQQVFLVKNSNSRTTEKFVKLKGDLQCLARM